MHTGQVDKKRNQSKERKLRLTPLSETHPNLSKQFHPTKNNPISPDSISASYAKNVWVVCEMGHETQITPRGHLKKDWFDCIICKSFVVMYPALAAEWHPSKNSSSAPPLNIGAGSHEVFWWKCQKGDDHEWLSSIRERVRGVGCQVCNLRVVVFSNCLNSTHPQIAAEWDYDHNNALNIDPTTVTSVSRIRAGWKCPKGHRWQASIRDRAKKNTSCAKCIGRKASPENNLTITHPELVLEWHPTLNGYLTPEQVTKGSEVMVTWQCRINKDHVWPAYVYSRSAGRGCRYCQRWSIESIRIFVASLLPFISTFDEAELYVIMQQNGLLDISDYAKGRFFVQGLKSGKFPKEELEKFVNGQPSLIDEVISDQGESAGPQNDDLEAAENEVVELSVRDAGELAMAETKDVLAAIDSPLLANLDAEVVDFLIKKAVAKIWNHAFKDEDVATQQLERFKEGVYSQEVKNLFLQDYNGAKALAVPAGYAFPEDPNLMQMYTAHLVKTRKRIGNWSGTGAGKTRSAVLASRVIDAKITVICCPNNVIDNWEFNIARISPEGVVHKKALSGYVDHSKPQYFILNYEFFQQPQAESKLDDFLKKHSVDFVIIDEIHFSKQREIKVISQRKKVIAAFLSQATAMNSDIHVLGMSATPVLNNLFEGKTLIELVTGIYHDDLQTKATVSNCISMYQKFIAHGIRWEPSYAYQLNIEKPEIDCSEFLFEIRHRIPGSMAGLEAILTKAKIPCILANIRPKTIVYSHYRQGIENVLKEAIEQQGWEVALFNGDTKEGLDEFISGNADVLIATSCIATGVDGLQTVCNRLIINALPWTHAEYKQLVGRIYRQGQINHRVDVIIPIAYAYDTEGKRKSHCEFRWNRIEFKRSIADAAVDGIIPEEHLRSEAQVYKDFVAWIERLDDGVVYEIERQRINMTLSDTSAQVAIRRVGDLSLLNQKINRVTSAQTHQRFLKNPVEWHEYHEAYRENRKDWEVVPYQEAIKWCKVRPQAVVADFGCGEALLAKELQNKVHSFDHVAINGSVIACDMSHVPLDDASIDVAIFSLSLMGSNWIDYLKEAKRCLRLDGHLWIAEPTGRIQDADLFRKLLEYLGFDARRVHAKDKFTFVEALKSDRDVNELMVGELMEREILN